MFVLLAYLFVQGIDELGHNFFKLEAYFVTHFLYVVSEWGKHTLQTELFWEEINFIVKNMKHVRVPSSPFAALRSFLFTRSC